MGNAAGWGGLLPRGQKLMMGFAAARMGGSHGVLNRASGLRCAMPCPPMARPPVLGRAINEVSFLACSQRARKR